MQKNYFDFRLCALLLSTPKTLPALMVAIITAGFAHSALAGMIEPTLTLTEVSNTQLNWSWDAAGGGTSGSITALSADQWLNTSISGPTLSAMAEGSGTWTEPDNAGSNNYVNVAYTGTTWLVVTVNSDVTGAGTLSDGMAADFGGFQVKFFDNAATSEPTAVPDTGSTVALFALALAAVFGARRLPLIHVA